MQKRQMVKTLLISCGKEKRQSPFKAKNLYCGPLFIKQRLLAEEKFDNYFILSAKFGLLHPDEIIEPYDVKLEMSIQKEWITMVLEQVKNIKSDKIYLLGGELYTKNLANLLQAEVLFPKLPPGKMMAAINKELLIEEQFTGDGIVGKIIDLYDRGFSKKDIIAKGYSSSTVHRQVKEYETYKSMQL